jgi:hypothetical protein
MYRAPLAAMIIAAGLLLAPPGARADIPPANAEPCLGKKAGDSCSLEGKSGKCESKTCTRASPSGATTAYDCLLCTPGADDGGCNVGGARPVLPLALAGGVALVVLRWRRRR